jgi:aminopeptidase YwaD
MPKNFVFYNPDHHQRTIALLESRKPAAIIATTESKPEQLGALYPFPLMVDGDFDIPSVYCRDVVGDVLEAMQGHVLRLSVDASRLPSSATSVVARLNGDASGKIVITAHIDAYEDSPGASDNASGTVVPLLCAEMLSEYRGDHCIEIVALNGEDHYSAGGQMDYLNRYGGEFSSVILAVNVDDVGYKHGGAAYSFYGCSTQLEKKAEAVFRRFEGLVRGDQWFSGDHMIFAQHLVPSVALTAEHMPELMRTVRHTALDTPDIVDCHRLVEVAESLSVLARSLQPVWTAPAPGVAPGPAVRH